MKHYRYWVTNPLDQLGNGTPKDIQVDGDDDAATGKIAACNNLHDVLKVVEVLQQEVTRDVWPECVEPQITDEDRVAAIRVVLDDYPGLCRQPVSAVKGILSANTKEELIEAMDQIKGC